MKVKEAIEELECIMEYRLFRTYEYEAVRTAIRALEKEVPKEPKKLKSCEYKYCPTCNISINKHETVYSNTLLSRCKWCGQKIDWK